MNPFFPAAALYAALYALLLLLLALLVVRQRGRHRVVFGEGEADATSLRLAIRAHANAVEFLPISLFVLYACELCGMAPLGIHAWGSALLLARIAHAWGLSRSGGTSIGRAAGAGFQFLFLLVLPVWLVLRFLGVA